MPAHVRNYTFQSQSPIRGRVFLSVLQGVTHYLDHESQSPIRGRVFLSLVITDESFDSLESQSPIRGRVFLRRGIWL